jgi:glutamate racemase
LLGIFDSGLGGLSVLRRVRARLPAEDLVYLADQAHVPYGDRSVEELRRYLVRNVAYLDACGVDAIVMGCNTSCAIAAREGWPVARVPILDLIEAAAAAVVASGARRVGVLATSATARSGAYGNAIRRLDPGISVEEVAAPALVPLVEAGCLSGDVARAAVENACAPFRAPLDALVLACTHFPFLDSHFAAVLGPDTLRIDPSAAQAERAVAFATLRGAREAETGRTRYVTTGALEPFRAALPAFAGVLGPHDGVERSDPEDSLRSDPEDSVEEHDAGGAQDRAAHDLQRGVRL